MSAPAQRSFAGGELSPACYARTDQVKYATGLRTCRNFIVQRHGGATNRPGTKYIGAVKDASKTVRLVKFVLDGTDIADTYIMEFGVGYIRFFQDAGRVVVSGLSAWVTATDYTVGDLVSDTGVDYYCRTAHTSAVGTDRPGVDASWQTNWWALTGTTYEIPTPYVEADLPSLQFSQTGDIITIVHPNYAPRELRRYSHTRWILAAIAFGPSVAAPSNIAATSAGAAGTTYYAVTAVKVGSLEESLAGLYTFAKVPASANPAAVTWDSVAGAISYNVYRGTDGVTYGLIGSGGGLPVLVTDTAWTDNAETANGVDSSDYTPAAGQMRNPLAAISATNRAYDGNYNLQFSATLSAVPTDPALIGNPSYGRYRVYYSRDGEARIQAKVSDPFSVGGAGSYGPITVNDSISVPDNGYATLQIDIVPEVQAPETGGSAAFALDASAGSVYWSKNAVGFSDVGDAPDYSLAPPVEPSLFDTADRQPAAVGVYQQRRMLASTSEEPEKVWGSRTGSYSSFSRSTPLQDDDAISFALAGNRVNVVKHLMDLARLLVFTTGSVLAVDGDQAGTLKPDAINPRKVARQGIGTLFPLEVDDAAIYVQSRGSIVRSLVPVEAGGAFGGYKGSNLCVFANHLFDGYTIVDWDYAEEPGGIVWAVRSDGTLLGLTYLAEHAVWGWHRHDTDGVIENVCTVPERADDVLYLVVRRTINGATVRYIERLAPRFFSDITAVWLVDAGLSYDGTNTGAEYVVISNGGNWDNTELLSITSSAGIFLAGDVGNAMVFTEDDGSTFRLTITEYVSATLVRGFVDRTVPVAFRTVHITGWAKAVKSVSGADHLEGKAVSVLADGFVASSPNNADYPTVTVTGGVITLDRPYVKIIAGLPYISDLETLDLDSPGPRTIKDKKMLVTKVGLFVEKSRGIWTGRPDKPTTANPLNGLQEFKSKEPDDVNDPPALQTDYLEVTIDGSWNTNGRVLVRQVDPLPLTVLSATPIGYIAA